MTPHPLIAAMPKAELHLHLEGSLSAETILTLARLNHLTDLLPGERVEHIREWYSFQDFYHFMDVNRTVKNLLRTEEDWALAVYQVGQDLAAQNVRYAEITVTPYTHIHFLQKNTTIDLILNGLSAGRQQVRETCGVELRWVFDIPRNRAFEDYRLGGKYVPGAAERTLEFALYGQDRGVVGLGLGGSETNAPPEPFAHVFAEAKQAGLLSVPHAGEGEGPASVWGAIDALQADRVGHGVRAAEDEELIAVLAERRIPLEINPTSNICLKFYPTYTDHPLVRLDQAGVLVTINTDDPPLFNTTLSQEYQLLLDEFGYALRDVVRLARNAFQVSGAEPALKAHYLQAFDQWMAGNIQEE